jgi:hypothetical protein
MISPIPVKIKKKLLDSGFMDKCCISDSSCSGRIEWHHNLIFAGSRINEAFCILPVCSSHHAREKNPIIGEKLDYIMLTRATDEELKKYSKTVNYIVLRAKLLKKYTGVIVKEKS